MLVGTVQRPRDRAATAEESRGGVAAATERGENGFKRFERL